MKPKARKEYPATGPTTAEPVHPGEILREDVLPAMGLSASEAAQQLRISRQTLHRVLAGQISVSADMAVRLGKFCGNGTEIWQALQSAFDRWHAEKRLRDEIKRIPTPRAASG